MLGTSGGGPSALQFALRHRVRCRELVLTAAVTQHLPPRAKAVDRSDFLYWLITTYLRRLTFSRLGMSTWQRRELAAGVSAASGRR
ncbi:MAG: hypothetical protein B7733_24010 [Myxococcales bacterium FL481]|nr:MAG: hypothetical protein B7733_24010 [Myxococcales bacterium FL481]